MHKIKKILWFSVVVAIIGFTARTVRNELKSDIIATAVVRDTAIDAVPAIINVRSDYAMTLSSEETGPIIHSNLKLGGIIQKDDLLIQLDATDLQIEIEILKADIHNLENRLALTAAEDAEIQKREEDLKNQERLFELGNYPELEIKRRRREFKVYKESLALKELNEQQQLNRLNGNLKKVDRRLDKTKIYSPADGIVTEINAYPGELVRSGTDIATIFSKAIVVEAKINEEDFAGVTVGQDATLRLLTYGNKLYKGKVSRVLPTADKENQQYTVFLEVDIWKKKLLPGLSGEASIIRKRKPDALIIPRRALLGQFVFVAKDGTAIFTPVKTGVRGLNQVEILEGLEEGDLVITDGLSSLRDGDAIIYSVK